jgi:hypothetical protein
MPCPEARRFGPVPLPRARLARSPHELSSRRRARKRRSPATSIVRHRPLRGTSPPAPCTPASSGRTAHTMPSATAKPLPFCLPFLQALPPRDSSPGSHAGTPEPKPRRHSAPDTAPRPAGPPTPTTSTDPRCHLRTPDATPRSRLRTASPQARQGPRTTHRRSRRRAGRRAPVARGHHPLVQAPHTRKPPPLRTNDRAKTPRSPRDRAMAPRCPSHTQVLSTPCPRDKGRRSRAARMTNPSVRDGVRSAADTPVSARISPPPHCHTPPEPSRRGHSSPKRQNPRPRAVWPQPRPTRHARSGSTMRSHRAVRPHAPRPWSWRAGPSERWPRPRPARRTAPRPHARRACSRLRSGSRAPRCRRGSWPRTRRNRAPGSSRAPGGHRSHTRPPPPLARRRVAGKREWPRPHRPAAGKAPVRWLGNREDRRRVGEDRRGTWRPPAWTWGYSPEGAGRQAPRARGRFACAGR